MPHRPDLATPAPVTADPMVPAVARVLRRRREGADIVTLDLDPAGLPPFAPGQFNMLTAFGVGDVPISISGDAERPDRLVHTIRDVGAVSGALSRLKAGDAVGLLGPFGVGWPMAEAEGRDVVVVAGGLGLAPLRPALYTLLTHRDRFGKVVLLYGTRSPNDILFPRELETWRRRGDLQIEVTVDHAVGDWHGHVGVVPKLIPRAAFDAANAVAMVCGPEVMMRFSVAALREAGLADDAIYLSMERSMKCAVGFCGHCQLGPVFVCHDGPVIRYDRIAHLLPVTEL